MLFISHSLKGCFFWQFGQNTARGLSTFPCVLLIYVVIIKEERVLRISVLKFSKKFSISTLVTPLLAYFCMWIEASRIVLLPLDDPREHLRQRFTISSNGSCDISPFPNRFRVLRQSSLIPLMNIVFNISGSKLLCLDVCRL